MTTKINPVFLLLNTDKLSAGTLGIWTVLYITLTAQDKLSISGTIQEITDFCGRSSTDETKKALDEIKDVFSTRCEVKEENNVFTVTIIETEKEKRNRQNRKDVGRCRAKKKSQMREEEKYLTGNLTSNLTGNLTGKEKKEREKEKNQKNKEREKNKLSVETTLSTRALDFSQQGNYPENLSELKILLEGSGINATDAILEHYLQSKEIKGWKFGNYVIQPTKKAICADVKSFINRFYPNNNHNEERYTPVSVNGDKDKTIPYPRDIEELKNILERSGTKNEVSDDLLDEFLTEKSAAGWKMGRNIVVHNTPFAISQELKRWIKFRYPNGFLSDEDPFLWWRRSQGLPDREPEPEPKQIPTPEENERVQKELEAIFAKIKEDLP